MKMRIINSYGVDISELFLGMFVALIIIMSIPFQFKTMKSVFLILWIMGVIYMNWFLKKNRK